MLQKLDRAWNNFSFRRKMSILLMTGAIVPTFVATQGIISLGQTRLLQDLQVTLKIQLNTLETQLNDTEGKVALEARNLAIFVESQGGDLSDPQELTALSKLLSNYVRVGTDNSFYLITDAQGRTVAQYIQQVRDNFSSYPSLPKQDLKKPEFSPVSLPIGINLGDIPILQNAINSRRSLSGAELFKSEWLKRLGLEQQANIGIRAQKIEGLPEAKQPFAKGTYEIDEGKVGLAIVAVHPIQVQEKLVGTIVVGTLLNRNFEIVDRLKQEVGVSTATLFAKDWRISTNVPYTDRTTRAIGTRVSREVATTVLNQKKVFIGAANIIGIDYITGYSPIYDHQEQLNSIKAEPVGIAYVGEPTTEVEKTLNILRFAGWGIGAGIALLAGLVAIPVAATFSNSLQRLANCAQKVGEGDLTTVVPLTNAQDEIGMLLISFQNMTDNLNSLILHVQKSIIQITATTTEIAAEGKQLEATMTEQIASTNRVAATAKVIVATSGSLIETMDEVQQTTAQAAGESKKDLMYMETTMYKLVDATDTISTKLGTINEKANNINKILTTIAKVADQTNLISLNAAIEAEKAGQYGLGFAVVAREIRRLADQTGVAALEIENMVEQMQAAVSSGMTEMDNFTNQVKQSFEVVHNISTKLELIIEQVQSLTPRFQAVSNSMEAQSQSAEEINDAMVQLSEDSSQTAESLLEINSSLGELKNATQGLRHEISRFKVAGS
ncbi:methyl-accepting chemotaxis protein [Argonema antarcticum]|uniref:methyl-accepting chemotaxis protein n=1 Tax=Argonema antarcticum TaxID=2942763 RepID=UPI0020115861|nr:methyl-accepting chemotaxis protein [Argonema antarcticum A004/B2]